MKKCFICQVQTNTARRSSRNRDRDKKKNSTLPNCADDLHYFNKNTFQKCRESIKYRKSHGHKYGDLILTKASRTRYAYHLDCYKKLTTFKKNYTVIDITDTDSDIEDSSKCEKFIEENYGPGRDSEVAKETNKIININKSKNDRVDTVVEKELNVGDIIDLSSDDDSTHITKENEPMKICVFCQQNSTHNHGNPQFCKIMRNVKRKMRHYISQQSHETGLVQRLNNSTSIYFHQNCLDLFCAKYPRSSIKKDDSPWHKSKASHEKTFAILSDFIKEEVIKKEQIFVLDDIFEQYKTTLFKINNESLSERYCQVLEDKLLKEFSELIVIKYSKSMNKKMLYKKDIDVAKLVDNSVLYCITDKGRVPALAYDMHELIMSLDKKKLPENLTLEAIIEGECEIPQQLKAFVSCLIKGRDNKRPKNDDDDLRIRSICEDIIYSIHKGQIRPGKHIELGLTVNTLTNNKKVIDLLNRLGHSIGYSTAVNLETELTHKEGDYFHS